MRNYRQAISELASAQKNARGVSLYSRFVNRPAGRILAAACYVGRLSPNQVTMLSAFVTVIALAVLVTGPPTVWRGVVVSVLLLGGFALDSADGQVARLTGRGSAAGEWLDHVVDSGKIVAVHGAVLVMVFRFLDVPVGLLLAPLGFQLVSVVTFFGGELHRALSRSDTRPDSASEPSLVRSLALLPADYGILGLAFLLLGWPVLFITAYVVLLVANTVILALLLSKWFRSLSVQADGDRGASERA